MSSVRFQVSRAGENRPLGDAEQEIVSQGASYGTVSDLSQRPGNQEPTPAHAAAGGYTRFGYGEDGPLPFGEDDMLTEVEEKERGFALYEEDMELRPKIARMLQTLANYQAGIAPSQHDMEKAAHRPQSAKLGTVLGVFLPCLQNIFGVIFFTRLSWIVGMAGTVESFFLVFMCCSCTMLTAISMSAIATNGVVPGGGSYFMVSRSLGPEFGGAVGVLFYLGNTFAAAMYIIGACEILLKYLVPDGAGKIVGESLSNDSDAFNNYRIYGTLLLVVLFVCVFIGVRFVSIIAAISLSCVLLSILCVFIGVFVSSPQRSTEHGIELCYLGDRLLRYQDVSVDGIMVCSKNRTVFVNGVAKSNPLFTLFCNMSMPANTTSGCDEYFQTRNVARLSGVPGLGSGLLEANAWNHHLSKGDLISGSVIMQGDSSRYVVSDIATTFMVLVAIFFPSVTGIQAGANRSGDLADAQKSIPVGTIAAIITTSIVYLASTVLFGAVVRGDLLRDKYGESIGGRLIITQIAWPHYYVPLIGAFLATVGAGLQSLTGAPRLLNAIAKDGVIPFLNVFSKTTQRGEPLLALLLTAAICEAGVLIASVDSIAPIITMFFLVCKAFINLACALQTLLKTPNWRPRFRFYHWTLSLLGLALCVVLMFVSSWYYALVAIGIAIGIYKYIEYKGAEKEWGDGIRGLSLSAARFALLKLEQGPPHTKNWRPQILVFLKLSEDLQPRYERLLDFCTQLKAGKGLTIVASILQGEYKNRCADAAAAKQSLMKCMKEHRVKGFAEVVVSRSIIDAMYHMVQSAGLGGLKHNTILIGWPTGWRHEPDEQSWRRFIEVVTLAESANCALLVAKGVLLYPSSTEKLTGCISIWWIVHDGGLLLLLPFLLMQSRVWKNCTMKIYLVAQMEDNSIAMKTQMQRYLYQLRIDAEVEVVELADTDVSAYTYGRTIIMEQRTKILRDMKLTKKERIALTSLSGLHRQPLAEEECESDDAALPATVGAVSSENGSPSTSSGGDFDSGVPVNQSARNQYTYTGAGGSSVTRRNTDRMKELVHLKPAQKNVRRMHTAVRLNEVIVQKSHDARLVLINLPGPPKNESGYENYMEYLEVLTEGLERVLLVRGSGMEVITIYS